MLTEIKERLPDIIGKSAIAAGLASETGKQLGYFDNVSLIQIISAFGIIMLGVERTIKMYWESKEKGNTVFVVSILTLMWTGLIILTSMVI